MRVIHHAACAGAAGDAPRCVAGAEHGIAAFTVATQTLAPGAGGTLPVHGLRERVAIVLEGSGKLLVEGEPQRFHAPCTVVLPDGSACQIVNNGTVPLHLVWVSAPATDRNLERNSS